MKENNKQEGSLPVVVICAPTACGKTDLAYNLFATSQNTALAGKAEIISADSMQVYRFMDIGTAKPSKEFQKKLPHHLIDVCNPDYQFGAGDFVRNASESVLHICSRGKLPVMLGGTGFYLKNFVYGLPPTPKVDEKIRLEIENRMQIDGAKKLWDELQALDSISAEKIHVNDEYRIKRALEVCISTGRPRSSFIVPQKTVAGYNFLLIHLERPRHELYKRAEERAEVMFDLGLEKEVELLLEKGYTENDPGMQAIGYREFFSYSKRNDIKAAIIKNSKEYIKRQQTFFKTFKDAYSFSPDNEEEIERVITTFLYNTK